MYMKAIIENLKKECEFSLSIEPINPTEREIGYSICLKHVLTIIGSGMRMNVGDKVKIVNYGHLVWERKSPVEETPMNAIYSTEYIYALDLHPELVGRECHIVNVKEGYKSNFYKLSKLEGYYSEDQLEKL